MRFPIWLGGLAVALSLGAASAAPREAKPVLYKGLTLIDGTGAPPRADMAIVTQGERIAMVFPARQLEFMRLARIEVVDAKGLTALPGLINAHVHLAIPAERPAAEATLRRYLYGGVTAVRDVAGDARFLRQLKGWVERGEIAGPDFVYAALFAGPSYFSDDRIAQSSEGYKPGEAPWMRAIDKNSHLKTAVTQAKATGAAAIKAYANMDTALLGRLVAEAHAQNMKVWAHLAVFPATPAEVMRSGVDTVSHVCMAAYQGFPTPPSAYHDRPPIDEAQYMNGDHPAVQALFEEMARRGTILDTTVYVYFTIERLRAEMGPENGPPTYCTSDLALALTRQAHRAGVTLAAGTDSDSPEDATLPALHDELEALVARGGLSPMEAIVSATRNGAAAMGQSDIMGTIEAGKLANLVFVGGDPATDIKALRRVRFTVKRGVRYPRADYLPAAAD